MNNPHSEEELLEDDGRLVPESFCSVWGFIPVCLIVGMVVLVVRRNVTAY